MSGIITEWNDKNRRTVWFVMNKTKAFLKIDISPIIATAFYIMQTYFRETPDNNFKMVSLVVASLTFSCKLADTYRSIQSVFSAIIKVCLAVPSQALKEFLNGVDFIQDFVPSENEIQQVQLAEVSLMASLGFNFDIELPFIYIEKWEHDFLQVIPIDKQPQIVQQVRLDCCLLICSEKCLDVPAEVAAAAAVDEVMATHEPTNYFSDITNCIKEKYGSNIFDIAINSIRIESARTAPRRNQPLHQVQN